MPHFTIKLNGKQIVCDTLSECAEQVRKHIEQMRITASNFKDIEVTHTKYSRVAFIGYSGRIMTVNRTIHKFINVTATNY